MAGFHDVISKLDGNRQILTDGNVDIPFRSFIVDTLHYSEFSLSHENF